MAAIEDRLARGRSLIELTLDPRRWPRPALALRARRGDEPRRRRRRPAPHRPRRAGPGRPGEAALRRGPCAGGPAGRRVTGWTDGRPFRRRRKGDSSPHAFPRFLAIRFRLAGARAAPLIFGFAFAGEAISAARARPAPRCRPPKSSAARAMRNASSSGSTRGRPTESAIAEIRRAFRARRRGPARRRASRRWSAPRNCRAAPRDPRRAPRAPARRGPSSPSARISCRGSRPRRTGRSSDGPPGSTCAPSRARSRKATGTARRRRRRPVRARCRDGCAIRSRAWSGLSRRRIRRRAASGPASAGEGSCRRPRSA